MSRPNGAKSVRSQADLFLGSVFVKNYIAVVDIVEAAVVVVCKVVVGIVVVVAAAVVVAVVLILRVPLLLLLRRLLLLWELISFAANFFPPQLNVSFVSKWLHLEWSASIMRQFTQLVMLPLLLGPCWLQYSISPWDSEKS